MEKEYLTVSEAAEMAGVTPQAIYKRLKTTLKPYTFTVEGKKALKIEAIKLLINQPVEQPLNNVSTPLNNGLKQDKTEKILEETLKILQDQLKVKDDQLKEKDIQIQAKDDQLRALNDRLEQALQITGQANYLTAQAQQQTLNEPLEEQDPSEQPKKTEKPEDDQPIRLPWYKRIFK